MGYNIGILSMQRIINYGSVLQAYALKQILHQVSPNSNINFIDIENGRSLPGYAPDSFLKKILKRHPFSHPVEFINNILYSRKYRKSVMAGWPLLGINDINTNSSDCDIVVIGSDEVFNCCQSSSWGLSPQLYGHFDKKPKRVVSYAASFGNTIYKDLQCLDISNEIKSYLSEIDAISVRDSNSADIIKQFGLYCSMHIDPVLAYGYKDEIAEQFEIHIEKYAVVYSYHGRINNPIEIQEITKYAKKHGLKLVSIMCRYNWCDHTVVPSSPIDVLHWFKKATVVITDTFHGSIFSIISHSRFVTLIRESNFNKLTSLLSLVGLEHRGCSNPNDLISTLDNSIDYGDVETKLEIHRAKTKQFLSEQLCSIY